MPIESCMAACPARRSRMIVQGGCGHVIRTANSVTTANMSTIGSTWASIQKPTAISLTLRFFFSSTCLNSLVLYGLRFEKSSLYSQDTIEILCEWQTVIHTFLWKTSYVYKFLSLINATLC